MVSALTRISQDGRSRQGSVAPSPVISYNPPRRAETSTSLPPYSASPPQPHWEWERDEEHSPSQGKKPSDLLFKKDKDQEKRSGPELDSSRFKFLVETDEKEEKNFRFPNTSPFALRPGKAPMDLPEWGEELLKPISSRQGTETEIAVGSPESSKSLSSSPESSWQRKPPRTFTGPPSYPSSDVMKPPLSLSTGLGLKTDDVNLQSQTTPEASMENLRGVKMYVIGSKRIPSSNRIY